MLLGLAVLIIVIVLTWLGTYVSTCVFRFIKWSAPSSLTNDIYIYTYIYIYSYTIFPKDDMHACMYACMYVCMYIYLCTYVWMNGQRQRLCEWELFFTGAAVLPSNTHTWVIMSFYHIGSKAMARIQGSIDFTLAFTPSKVIDIVVSQISRFAVTIGVRFILDLSAGWIKYHVSALYLGHP